MRLARLESRFVRTRADLLFARPNLLFKYCTCLLFEMSHVPLLLKLNSKTGKKITVNASFHRVVLISWVFAVSLSLHVPIMMDGGVYISQVGYEAIVGYICQIIVGSKLHST